MAKNTKGGLGRGIGSLMGNENNDNFSNQRTTNRDRIVYDEREDVVYENNEKKPVDERTTATVKERQAQTEKKQNVSRETSSNTSNRDKSDDNKGRIAGLSSTGSFMPVDEDAQAKPLIEEVVEEKIDEKAGTEPYESTLVYEVPIDEVQPNPDQPRTNFKEEDLKELTNSIKREGLIQPILVRKIDDGYQIIAGERRWQASKRAGLTNIPVQIKDVDDEKALELALIENIQRSDLNPIEEAYAYKRLMDRNQMTQADIAQAVSKGRSTIANALRLLELPEEAQKLLFDEEISAGHARAILSVPTKEGRLKLTEKLMDNKMSVREVESLARLMSNKPSNAPKKEPAPPVYKSVVRSLKATLDTEVKIRTSGGKNKIEIVFTDENDLERIFDILSPE